MNKNNVMTVPIWIAGSVLVTLMIAGFQSIPYNFNIIEVKDIFIKVAPISEELAKYWALMLGHPFIYTFTFAITETLLNIKAYIANPNMPLGTFIGLRSLAFAMHITTICILWKTWKWSKDKPFAMGYVICALTFVMGFHGLYNDIMLKSNPESTTALYQNMEKQKIAYRAKYKLQPIQPKYQAEGVGQKQIITPLTPEENAILDVAINHALEKYSVTPEDLASGVVSSSVITEMETEIKAEASKNIGKVITLDLKLMATIYVNAFLKGE